MRSLQLIGAIGFLLASTAWAGPPQPALQRAATAPSSATVHHRVVRSRAEVKRLEHDLARQESDSKRAGERLQQQDQTIAELQKQLHELQATPPDGQH